MVGSIKSVNKCSDMESFYDEKSLFCMTAALFALPTVTSAASPYFSLKDGDGFKRFSVSAGHAMPQASGKPLSISILALQKVQNLKLRCIYKSRFRRNRSK